MNNEPFHELTPAEQERLACLSEECAEVIQIINKIWRHGYQSTHPDKPEGDNNRDMLTRELGHVHFWIDQLLRAGDIDGPPLLQSAKDKKASSKVYLHHQ